MKNDDEQFETLTQHISAVGSDVKVLKDAMHREYSIAKSVAEKAVEAAQKVHDKMEYKFADVHEKLDGILSQTTRTNGRVNKLENWRWFVVGCTAVILVLVPTLYYANIDRVSRIEETANDLNSNRVTKEDLQNFREDIKGMLQTYTSQLSKRNDFNK